MHTTQKKLTSLPLETQKKLKRFPIEIFPLEIQKNIFSFANIEITDYESFKEHIIFISHMKLMSKELYAVFTNPGFYAPQTRFDASQNSKGGKKTIINDLMSNFSYIFYLRKELRRKQLKGHYEKISASISPLFFKDIFINMLVNTKINESDLILNNHAHHYNSDQIKTILVAYLKFEMSQLEKIANTAKIIDKTKGQSEYSHLVNEINATIELLDTFHNIVNAIKKISSYGVDHFIKKKYSNPVAMRLREFVRDSSVISESSMFDILKDLLFFAEKKSKCNKNEGLKLYEKILSSRYFEKIEKYISEKGSINKRISANNRQRVLSCVGAGGMFSLFLLSSFFTLGIFALLITDLVLAVESRDATPCIKDAFFFIFMNILNAAAYVCCTLSGAIFLSKSEIANAKFKINESIINDYEKLKKLINPEEKEEICITIDNDNVEAEDSDELIEVDEDDESSEVVENTNPGSEVIIEENPDKNNKSRKGLWFASSGLFHNKHKGTAEEKKPLLGLEPQEQENTCQKRP